MRNRSHSWSPRWSMETHAEIGYGKEIIFFHIGEEAPLQCLYWIFVQESSPGMHTHAGEWNHCIRPFTPPVLPDLSESGARFPRD